MKKKVLVMILLVCMELCACGKEQPVQKEVTEEKQDMQKDNEETAEANKNDFSDVENDNVMSGDSAGGRPEYTIDQINNGELGDTITFNSISDNPMGHEFNFVDAREDTGINVGKDNVWNANDITIEDGKTYIVRMYVHNNNPNGRDAIAKDVHVAFSIPGDTGSKIQVNGFINSSNATPKEYWDEVNFNSDHAFHLEYVTGSARLSNNGVGNVKQADERNGISIGDDLVYNPNGIKIGYDSVESGEVPGCFEYDNIVTVLVKAVYDN